MRQKRERKRITLLTVPARHLAVTTPAMGGCQLSQLLCPQTCNCSCGNLMGVGTINWESWQPDAARGSFIGACIDSAPTQCNSQCSGITFLTVCKRYASQFSTECQCNGHFTDQQMLRAPH